MKKVIAPTALTMMLLLSGCVENSTSADGLTVTATDTACEVSVAEATSGNQTFTIKNEGSKVNEFYLLGSDGLQIVAEKENIAPGASAELVVALAPGDYFTACKPGLRGANVDQKAFKVTGEALKVTADDQERFDKAVANYVNFAKNEVAALAPKAEAFADAYAAGDDQKARELYAGTRLHYERIEPLAEALGTLDPRIDYREVDYLAEAEELQKEDATFDQWLGFHRMEKDLWVPAKDARNADGTPAWEGWEPTAAADRQEIADALKADINKLYDVVHDPNFVEDQDITVGFIANGAAGLLEEIAVTKVTGEENWWSHYDLWDFQGNLQGSRIAFDLVEPIAADRGEEGKKLVEDINTQFDELQSLLDEYGNLEDGYVLYDQVSADQQAELTRKIDELREPLSKLTGTVLNIGG